MKYYVYLDISKIEIEHHVGHQDIAKSRNIFIILSCIVGNGTVCSIDILFYRCFDGKIFLI